MIERVTTAFELLGVVLLTAALGLATYRRFGPIWALVALALACFLWSFLFEMISGRLQPSPEAET